jgi:hypothetical protein
LVIGFGIIKGVTFVRLVTINPSNTENDILDLFKTIEDFVKNNKNLF